MLAVIVCDPACGSTYDLSVANAFSMIWQALVELYEYLLKCSCDMAQEAPPQRKSCVLSKPPPPFAHLYP